MYVTERCVKDGSNFHVFFVEVDLVDGLHLNINRVLPARAAHTLYSEGRLEIIKNRPFDWFIPLSQRQIDTRTSNLLHVIRRLAITVRATLALASPVGRVRLRLLQLALEIGLRLALLIDLFAQLFTVGHQIANLTLQLGSLLCENVGE